MISMYDAIDGDFFESLGNNSDVMYFKTDNVCRAFEEESHHHILITHNSDINIDENLYRQFEKCGKYDLWYAQNVNCKHERLIPIPIGLERRRWCKFNKFETLMKCKGDFMGTVDDMLYANFSIGTKSDKRSECINSFRGKSYLVDKVRQYVPNVSVLTREQYAQYCNDILSHKFVLCPEGNGLDTHRLWETLYLGRIPVVLHNPVNDAFSDMPILILDKWSDFEKHINDNISGSYEKLSQSYWKNIIK